VSAYAAPDSLSVTALAGVPEIGAGADLAGLLLAATTVAATPIVNDDVIVVAQKIVSKAEGRRVSLAGVVPSAPAVDLAARTGKDARIVELVLRESRAVLRVGPEVIVVEDVRGLVLANAGVDQSNVGTDGAALLLPVDPDASARRLRDALGARAGVRVGVVIADSLGRAWRLGTVGHAIGAAGLPALVDLRGRRDRDGRTLRHSEIGLADAIAAAALLAMGEGDEGRPAAIVRGFGNLARASEGKDEDGARALQRPKDTDLFR
jgi:coenzyme F420-0:L-glutamate ligase/coenzyme F420-1:gamma-L-glutamate ligase